MGLDFQLDHVNRNYFEKRKPAFCLFSFIFSAVLCVSWLTTKASKPSEKLSVRKGRLEAQFRTYLLDLNHLRMLQVHVVAQNMLRFVGLLIWRQMHPMINL